MGEFAIGQPVLREEDPRLLTGRGEFLNDVNLHGQAHGYVLRSPRAHATIVALDISAAEAAPGVVAVDGKPAVRRLMPLSLTRIMQSVPETRPMPVMTLPPAMLRAPSSSCMR